MPSFDRPRPAPRVAVVVEPLERRRLLAASPANPFPDDGGPDQASAVYLGRLNDDRPTVRTARGIVEPGEVQDVYRIKLDRETDLTVVLSGLAPDYSTTAYLTAHGAVGTTPAKVVWGTTTYQLSARVPAGSWYVGVFGRNDTLGGDGPGRDRPYVLRASGKAAPPPAAPAALSQPEARTAAGFTRSGGLAVAFSASTPGRVDVGRNTVYRLNVESRHDLAVGLSGVKGAGASDVGLTLFDAAGRGVGESEPRNPQRVTARALPPGTYFASIRSRRAAGVQFDFDVQYSRTSPAPAVEATLSRDAARSAYVVPGIGAAGTLFATRSSALLPGAAEGGEPAVYRLDLPRSGGVSLALENLTDFADLTLFDPAGRIVERGTVDDRSIARLEASLGAGSYYVHARGRQAGRVEYNLRVDVRLDESRPSTAVLTPDAARTAYRLPDPADATIAGRLDGDRPAVYRIDVPRPSVLRVVLDVSDDGGGVGDLVLTLFDDQGRVLDASDNVGANREGVVATVPAGSYYAHVSAPEPGRYGFTLATVVEPDGTDDGGAPRRR